MRVYLLGPLRLRAANDMPIDLGGTRVRMLLARLALDAGQVVGVPVLIDGLWGDNPPADATNALQSLVSRLRRSLKAADEQCLRSHPAGYLLDIAREDVDLHEFERVIADGRAELRADRAARAVELLGTAMELWRGLPFAGLTDAPFTDTATTRLTELHTAAREDLIEATIAIGGHDDVLAELRGLVADQPLRERPAILLVKALYLAGRQSDALAAYDTTRHALADELGVEPSAELRRVHLAVLRNDPELTPKKAPTQRGGRLPAPLTSFVGRDTELHDLLDRLTSARLVTLLGPGGAGKTRLATEVAAHRQGPSWFVELAGVRDGEDVVAATLSAMGVRELRLHQSPTVPAPVLDTVDRLVEALSAQQCLLVLDNCEHVITAAATLAATLLARCPGLHVLATSREPLAITGELSFPLGPLELPDGTASPSRIGETEAVRLFVDRAGAARPDFTLDEENAATVAEICRGLDGMPLALELAAARLRSMTVTQIADRLDDRFRLLTGGNRTSLPRHRTLRAVVEWSWDLLEKPERILARRLSVFPAGATVESAAAVCADERLPEQDVVYVLSSLVEKSLAEVSERANGNTRYRMLETVRAYAGERLAEADEVDQVRQRFTAYFLRFTEQAEPQLRGADQVYWLAKLVAEQDNTMTALRHAVDAKDADTATRMAVATGWYWMLSGRFTEALAVANRVLELPGSAPAAAKAALRTFTTMGRNEGLADQAELASLRDELEASRAMETYPMLAMMEPMLAAFSGDLASAERTLERATTHPDAWGRAGAGLGRAFLYENEGRPVEAHREAELALERFRELGDRWGQAMALSQLSERWSLRAEHDKAIAAYEESVRLISELGAKDDLPEHFARMAGQRFRAGDDVGGERDLRRALEMVERHSTAESEAIIRCALSTMYRQRGQYAEAWEQLDQSEAILNTMSRTIGQWKAMLLTARSGLLLVGDDVAGALRALAEALDGMTAMLDMPVVAMISDCTAQAVDRRGETELAARLIGIGTAVRGMPDLGNPELVTFRAVIVEKLGARAVEAAYDAGAALARDDAIAELRGVLTDGGPPPR